MTQSADQPDIKKPAYNEGVAARLRGNQLGANPYDPENEADNYELWVDGWSTAAST
jgi:hypothetical protein